MDDRPSISPAKYAVHIATVIALVLLSWLAMVAVHELGHLLAARLTGGTVQRVVLHPLAFSRTDVLPNPSPLTVAWAGPVVGVLFPTLLWLFIRCLRIGGAWLFQFFALFCLLVNGVYIGIGWINHIGDAGDLLRHGSERWQLITFGLFCLISAAVCGRGLESRLRSQQAITNASGRQLALLVLLLMITVVVMLWCSPVD